MDKKVKNLTYKYTYNFMRKMLILENITNVGKIIEEEDKFICYVNAKMVKKKFMEYSINRYVIGLKSLIVKNEELQKIAQKYNYAKPVYYVFENIDFDKKVTITTSMSNCYVIFRNCKFRDCIYIDWANDITFENNQYYNDRNLSNRVYLFNKVRMLNKLTFINDNFINSCINNSSTNFGINLDLDTLEIINTKIDTVNTLELKNNVVVPNFEGLNIKADKINIINSDINVAELYLDCKDILIDEKSVIKVSDGVIIFDENNNLKTKNIKTPYLVYNGKELINYDSYDMSNKNYIIDYEVNELKHAREQLLKMFKIVVNKGRGEINKTIIKIENNLDSKPLSKILKKK